MKPARYFLIPVVAITILTISHSTRAQYRDSLGTPWNNPISATTSTMIRAQCPMQAICTSRTSGIDFDLPANNNGKSDSKHPG